MPDNVMSTNNNVAVKSNTATSRSILRRKNNNAPIIIVEPTSNTRTTFDVLYAFHNATWWKVITIFASFVMIFFNPVVSCFLYYNQWRPLFISIFALVFLIISVDVLMKAIADPEYFSWYCSCGQKKTRGGDKKTPCCSRKNSHTTAAVSSKGHKICSMGSFFFWMDAIALGTFLWGFIYRNAMQDPFHIEINISKAQMKVAENLWLGLVDLIFIIGTSAIFARLFRASNIVEFLKLGHVLRFQVANLWNQVCSNNDSSDSATTTGSNSTIRRYYTFNTNKNSTIVDMSSNSNSIESSSAAKIQRKWRSFRRSGNYNIRESSNEQRPFTVTTSAAATATSTTTNISRSSIKRKKLFERTESSRVGTAMRESSAKNVAALMFVALFVTLLIPLIENINANSKFEQAMMTLHRQTQNPLFANRAIDVARSTAAPFMYKYVFANGTAAVFPTPYDVNKLYPFHLLTVTVNSTGGITKGVFITVEEDLFEMYSYITISSFIILVWFCGVVGLVSPIMALVVAPIDRMIRLLTMLKRDPLGYQKTENYKRFAEEEDDVAKTSSWEKEVLEGMETSFLQATILRIGSLMSVGFGSAGVDIIRQYLLKGSSTSKLTLHQRGTTVNCIFLFCDIRQFTDATEALQEEVFVFTNKIAYVIHSLVHSYGGSAIKNIGDAFLVSWRLLDDTAIEMDFPDTRDVAFNAHKADKALYSVVKIRLALQNNSYFLKDIGASAKGRLMEKLGTEKGPVVRMGFGLHAGKAVQGAIGSQRKIDPTYIGEAHERSEMLESLTKRYGLTALMSDSFYNILSPDVRRRCRMVDRIKLDSDDDQVDDYCIDLESETMTLYTFDMDIEALHQPPESRAKTRRQRSFTGAPKGSRRLSAFSSNKPNAKIVGYLEAALDSSTVATNSNPVVLPSAENSINPIVKEEGDGNENLKLRLSPYHSSVWESKELGIMRIGYTDGFFNPMFTSAIESYLNGDWGDAANKFTSILDRMKDGPSSFFLSVIDANGGRPFPGFDGYNTK